MGSPLSFIDRINECNTFNPAGYIPFIIGEQCVGLLKKEFADHLKQFTSVFGVLDSGICFTPQLSTEESRTAAVVEIVQVLLDQQVISYVLNEPYPVKGHNDEIFFVIDRSLVPYFGFRSYGQHLNGYVRKSGQLHVWVAQRALDRRIFPGMLDNLVAGGLPHGLSLQENLLKECYEEAGMPADIAINARPVAAITYNGLSPRGYKPDTLYCYDLELPEDFQPVNTDGEVEKFELMPVDVVMNIVRQEQRFKPNCNLVLIDFFTRNGLIDAQDPEFLPIQQAMHVPFMYGRWES